MKRVHTALILQGRAALDVCEAGVRLGLLEPRGLRLDAISGRLAEFSNRNRLTPEHVLASASLPPVLPTQTFDGHAYRDGGLISNTPLRPAIDAIGSSNQHDLKLRGHRRIDRLTVVRTPQPELLGGPADFSIPSIEARIALGRQDARVQLRARTRSVHPARPPRPRRKRAP